MCPGFSELVLISDVLSWCLLCGKWILRVNRTWQDCISPSAQPAEHRLIVLRRTREISVHTSATASPSVTAENGSPVFASYSPISLPGLTPIPSSQAFSSVTGSPAKEGPVPRALWSMLVSFLSSETAFSQALLYWRVFEMRVVQLPQRSTYLRCGCCCHSISFQPETLLEILALSCELPCRPGSPQDAGCSFLVGLLTPFP